MSPAEYLQEIAIHLGMTFVPDGKPFTMDPLVDLKHQGTIAGKRSGRLVIMSLLKGHNHQELAVMIRFPKVSDPKLMEPMVKQAFGIGKIAVSKKVTLANDNVTLHWHYALKKPSIDEVQRVLDSVLNAIAAFTTAFSGHCEDCGQVNTNAITLMNDVPGYHCSNCQQKLAEAKLREAREYESRDMGLPKALGWTGFAMVISAAVCGGAYYGLSRADNGRPDLRLFILLPLLIGIVVSLTFSKTVKRVDFKKQVAVVGLLSIVACLMADVVYYSLWYAHILGIALSMPLVLTVLRNLPGLRFTFDWHAIVTLCELASAFCAGEVLKRAQPKFVPVFRPLAEAAASALRVKVAS